MCVCVCVYVCVCMCDIMKKFRSYFNCGIYFLFVLSSFFFIVYLYISNACFAYLPCPSKWFIMCRKVSEDHFVLFRIAFGRDAINYPGVVLINSMSSACNCPIGVNFCDGLVGCLLMILSILNRLLIFRAVQREVETLVIK